MSDSRDKDKIEDVDFSWGIKRLRGGKNKEVQFYESFTYDGMEYFLYDSVYLFKKGEPEPYIGKLIKIWEHSNKTKKIKVLWFFKPSEISYYLGDETVLENELFLASGEGVGLANVNSLEAIAGKCNIICISKDERNHQPSDEELERADYVFYRTFDVGNFTISKELGENIAAIEVRFLLNKNDPQLPGVNPDDKNTGNVAGIDRPLVSVKDTRAEDEGIEPDAIGSLVVKDDKGTKDVVEKPIFHPPEKRGGAGPDEQASVSGKKTSLRSSDSDQTDSARVIKSAANVGPPEYKISLKSKLGGSVNTSNVKTTSSVKDSAPLSTADDKRKSELAKNINESTGAAVKVKPTNSRGALEEMPSKRIKLDDTTTPSSDKSKNYTQKSAAVSKATNTASRPVVSVKSETNGGGKLTEELVGTSNGPFKKLKSEFVGHGSAATETNGKSKVRKELIGTSNGISKKLDSEKVMVDKFNERLLKASSNQSKNIEVEGYGHVKEVTRRPEISKRNWFNSAHWEESMKVAQEQGTLVLLQNLDPTFTSSEVEDIVWHGVGESCKAKMVGRTAISSPHSGEAFAIFKTREAAEKVINRLDQECLMLPNGRPLVGIPWIASFGGKQSSFPGHLVIDKLKHQLQREAKAVSTSHSSQPNTLEYEMAIEWRLLQDRADLWWKKLYKQQGVELRKLKARLKSK